MMLVLRYMGLPCCLLHIVFLDIFRPYHSISAGSRRRWKIHLHIKRDGLSLVGTVKFKIKHALRIGSANPDIHCLV